MDAQCQRRSRCKNSQDVGLEAAIIERVRKSSLVECRGADNVARLKYRTEAVNVRSFQAFAWTGHDDGHGRGAFSSREARP